jgi:hypothetical protein
MIQKMADAELRRMAAFKLRHAMRQIAELVRWADESRTRIDLARIHAALITAVDRLAEAESAKRA